MLELLQFSFFSFFLFLQYLLPIFINLIPNYCIYISFLFLKKKKMVFCFFFFFLATTLRTLFPWMNNGSWSNAEETYLDFHDDDYVRQFLFLANRMNSFVGKSHLSCWQVFLIHYCVVLVSLHYMTKEECWWPSAPI